MDKPLWMWATFGITVLVLMALDLGVLNKRDREITVKQSLRLSAFYIAMGVAYGMWVWYTLGADSGKLFLTGYVVEKSLSMDNIFVMSLIFTHLSIPRQNRHKVLFWGILGAILLRGVMIGVGAAIVSQYHWVLYLFAAFLIYSGIKMLFASEEEPDVSEKAFFRFLKKHLRFTSELHGNRFTAMLENPKKPGKKIRYFTPLFLALLMVEVADIVFAVDSVPAIFALTTDPYIVYTSNIFAILGLRALFFALDAIMHRFEYLKYSLSLVLVFIGAKVFAPLVGLEEIPASVSLAVTLGLLGAGVLYSMYKTKEVEAKS